MGTTPPLDPNHYEKAKKNYFTARSWDENGHPKPETWIWFREKQPKDNLPFNTLGL